VQEQAEYAMDHLPWSVFELNFILVSSLSDVASLHKLRQFRGSNFVESSFELLKFLLDDILRRADELGGVNYAYEMKMSIQMWYNLFQEILIK